MHIPGSPHQLKPQEGLVQPPSPLEAWAPGSRVRGHNQASACRWPVDILDTRMVGPREGCLEAQEREGLLELWTLPSTLPRPAVLPRPRNPLAPSLRDALGSSARKETGYMPQAQG